MTLLQQSRDVHRYHAAKFQHLRSCHVLQSSSKKAQSKAGFSDQNKSWLKPKQQEAASDEEADDLAFEDSEGIFLQLLLIK